MAEAYLPIKAGAIRLVKVTQESSGTPGSFPNVTTPCVYKCMPASINYNNIEGSAVSIVDCTDPDRAIYVGNFRQNTPILGNYYFVYRLPNGKYAFDNQMAFLENQ
jgi:hypothetical protein